MDGGGIDGTMGMSTTVALSIEKLNVQVLASDICARPSI